MSKANRKEPPPGRRSALSRGIPPRSNTAAWRDSTLLALVFQDCRCDEDQQFCLLNCNGLSFEKPSQERDSIEPRDAHRCISFCFLENSPQYRGFPVAEKNFRCRLFFVN